MAIPKSSEVELTDPNEIISPLHSPKGLDDDVVLTSQEESLESEEELRKKKQKLESAAIEQSDSSQELESERKESVKTPKISDEDVVDEFTSAEIERKNSLMKDDSGSATSDLQIKEELDSKIVIESKEGKGILTEEESKTSADIGDKTSVAKGISELYKKHFNDGLEYAKRPTTRLLNAYFATGGLIIAGCGVAISVLTGGLLAPIGALYVGYGAVVTPIAGREALDPEYAAKNTACRELAKELGIKGIGQYTIPFTKAHKEKQQLLKIVESKGEINEENCESFGVDKAFFNKVALGLQKVQEREEQKQVLKVTTALALGKEIDSEMLGVKQELIDKVKKNLSKQNIISDENEISSLPKEHDKPATSVSIEEAEHTASGKEIKVGNTKPETYVESVEKAAKERETDNTVQI